MNITAILNRNFIFLGVPLILLLILVFLMQTPLLMERDIMDLAISIDLLIVVPLVYFLLIRKTEIPKTTVIPVVIAGLLIGSYFLPKESQSYLQLFKTWALPVIEVFILVFVITKVRDAIKKYKDLKGTSPDFFNTLKNVCYEILPQKLVLPFATELAVVYYGFIKWKSRKLKDNEFSYHKESGTPALFAVFILLIGVETIAIHILIALWSNVAAWIFTSLSLYTALQVFGFAKSLSRRPISINQKSLSLKYGILNEAEIPFSDIDHIELTGKSLPKDKLIKTLSPLGEIESHNVVLHLKKENELVGLYGMKKKFKILAFHIDNAKAFIAKLENANSKHSNLISGNRCHNL